MSHTTQIRETTFVHDGDPWGGYVTVRVGEASLRVHFSDLIDFVAGYARNRQIAYLESASSVEVLGLPPRRR